MRTYLAALIDHTLVRPDAVRTDHERLCREAAEHGFASVCVNSVHVALCTALLEDCQVPVAATVGFPLGATSARAKAIEAEEAVRDGALEIDMVCLIGALKDGRRQVFVDDIRRVRDAIDARPLKVILETCMLDDEEKRRGAEWVRDAGASYVKTSTGFGAAGATQHDVRLLHEIVGGSLGIKASGGIRDADAADKMVRAGATRLGTSAGVAIVTESATQQRGD